MKTIHILLFGVFTIASAQIPIRSTDGSGVADDDDIIELGSGKEETTVGLSSTTSKSVTMPYIIKIGGDDDEDESDIYISGSGSTPSPSAEPKPNSNPNMVCSEVYCWCVDENRVEIAGTRMFVDEPLCQPVKSSSTVSTTLFETTTPFETTTLTETPTTSTTTKRPMPPIRTKTTQEKPMVYVGKLTTTMSNEIVTRPPHVDIKEKDEEETNELSGTGKQINTAAETQRDKLETASLTHPGILAAVIAGGVVGLLCAVLLVMFIVYRMRKKDEGSYPLDDSKPPRLHTYTKPSNREFYA